MLFFEDFAHFVLISMETSWKGHVLRTSIKILGGIAIFATAAAGLFAWALIDLCRQLEDIDYDSLHQYGHHPYHPIPRENIRDLKQCDIPAEESHQS